MFYLFHNSLRKARNNDAGVTALLTLVFMMSAGLATLITLWAISVASGAFNLLYTSNQSAAYAAVTSVDAGNYATGDQLEINCSGSSANNTLCSSGEALDLAEAVFEASLYAEPEQYGAYGLRYNRDNPAASNVNWTMNFFNIPVSAGEARGLGCNIPSNRDFNIALNEDGPVMNCWRVREYGVEFPPQYQSGVITRANANVELVPGCELSICRTRVSVIASAVQDQPSPFQSYRDYYEYTPIISG
jgi:hypothetical protein